MNNNRIPVNNGSFIRVVPGADCVHIIRENAAGIQCEEPQTISGGDFVTLLNWYSYQKSNGNVNLIF